jgi:hypothetical protein
MYLVTLVSKVLALRDTCFEESARHFTMHSHFRVQTSDDTSIRRRDRACLTLFAR